MVNHGDKARVYLSVYLHEYVYESVLRVITDFFKQQSLLRSLESLRQV